VRSHAGRAARKKDITGSRRRGSRGACGSVRRKREQIMTPSHRSPGGGYLAYLYR
jgi:hypothetical protein